MRDLITFVNDVDNEILAFVYNGYIEAVHKQ